MQQAYFSAFNQWYHRFLALLLTFLELRVVDAKAPYREYNSLTQSAKLQDSWSTFCTPHNFEFTWRVLAVVYVTLCLVPERHCKSTIWLRVGWRRTCIGLEVCTCRKNHRVSQLSFRCHSCRYFERLQFVGTSRSDQRRQLCRTVRAAHSQNVHSWRKDSVLSVWQRWCVLLAKWLIQPASTNKW